MKEVLYAPDAETTVPTSEFTYIDGEIPGDGNLAFNERGPSRPASWQWSLERCYQIAKDNLVVHPNKSTWLMLWEGFLMGLLLLTAFYEPVVLALMQKSSLADTICNGFLDISFTTDMVLTFFLAFKHPIQSSSDDVWEKDLFQIAKRYTAFPLSDHGRAGWFWLDLLSVFPGWFELVLHCSDKAYGTSNADVTKRLHSVRIFRFLRLIRMLRMFRLAEVVQKLHARYGWPFYMTDICKFVVITLLACHWMACAWIIVEGQVTRGYISYNSHDEGSWLSVLIENKGDCCSPDATQDPLCVYILSSYWAMMTLTGVGYGDITPQNQLEIYMSSVVILVAGFFWSYIVGSVVGLLSRFDPEGKAWRQNMDEINDLMSNRNFPDHFTRHLRRYMIHAKHIPRIRSQQHLLKTCLSNGAQQQIAEQSHLVGILQTKVFWVSGLEDDAVLAIAAALQPFLYAVQESVNTRERMVIVQDGLMEAAGQLYRRGAVYGEETILLESPHLVSCHEPAALSFLEVRALLKDDLREVCQHFPAADKRMRRAQIRTAALRGFIGAAKRLKKGKSPASSRASLRAKLKSFVRGSSLSAEHDHHDMQVVLEDDMSRQSRMFEELMASTRLRITSKHMMLMERVTKNISNHVNELREEIAALHDD